MAWSQEDLTALETAIKGGEQRVKYRDREVTYREPRGDGPAARPDAARARRARCRRRKVAQISKGM